MQGDLLTDQELHRISDFFFAESGIRLGEAKKSLICGRLSKRLKALSLHDYSSYLSYLSRAEHQQERQLAVDLLTTNETFFYREKKHFLFLQDYLQQRLQHTAVPPKIWSAACSSGEEPYTLAMLLANVYGLQSGWKVLASDLSQSMLHNATQGIYPTSRVRELPAEWLKSYCLKGINQYDGFVMVEATLRQKVEFFQHNLMHMAPHSIQPDIIFLRNVLIYFSAEQKSRIVQQLTKVLKPGGLLIVGHSESLHDPDSPLKCVQSSVYKMSSL
ncbi:MAG: methyltransferase domain-containing protein [Gammaproteobacteria bacterium]|nr:methyltransferase domain-containing protein [Gammaproteobacteria bacterium]